MDDPPLLSTDTAMSPAERRDVLLHLAAEAILPVLGGCADAPLAGSPVSATVSRLAGRAVDRFAPRIAERWRDWLRSQTEPGRQAAFAELAALAVEEARRLAAALLARLAPDVRQEDREAAADYLAAFPATLAKEWLAGDATGDWAPEPTVGRDEPDDLLRLLPAHAPPYPIPADLPGTPYRLEQLLGAGGFGAVYRAAARSLQHLPFAVKFCLDPELLPALHLERDNLERLLRAGADPGARRVVRLYGYDFDHPTPYLVYEYVPGGDLVHHLTRLRRTTGRPLDAAETLDVIAQVSEALAFAHRHALVHRDLKPANILVDGDLLKLADFGLGGVAAARVARLPGGSRAGPEDSSVSRFRGAGTPLYMSPEQRLGAGPDPRHDLYSLGVMWHQLLIGDLKRPLHPFWSNEVAARGQVPRSHVALIERCVGRFDLRPRDAEELSALLRPLAAERRDHRPSARAAAPPPVAAKPGPRPAVVPPARNENDLLEDLKRLRDALAHEANARPLVRVTAKSLPWAILLFIGVFVFGLAVDVFAWFETPRRLRADIWSSLPSAGIAAGAAGFAAAVLLGRALYYAVGERRRRIEEAEDEFQEMAERHAGLVRLWGGPAILRDERSVGELIRHIRHGDPAETWRGRVRAPAPQSAGAPTKGRNGAAAILRRLLAAHDMVARRSRWPGNGLIIGLGLLVGGPAGWLIGELYYTSQYPDHGFLNAFRSVPFDGTAVVIGVVAGFALWAGVSTGLSLGWTWRLQSARRQVGGAIRELAEQFPREVESWGGVALLRDRDAVADLLHGLDTPALVAPVARWKP